MANWGAFAGGLADGIETEQKLRLQREAAARDKEEFEHKKKDWDRQEAMHAAIDAAPNTLAPDADPTKVLSPEDYAAQYAPKDVPEGGFRGWISRNFGSAKAAPTTPAAPEDFASKYNTAVPADKATDFDAWKSGLPKGMDQSGKDYDLGGAFMSGATPGDNGHLPDQYKKPNHPTFSNESVYSGKDHGVGGAWSQDDAGKWTFTASPDQLKTNHPDDIKGYFDANEKDSKLVLPAAPGGAFAAAQQATAPKKSGPSKDDYVPVTLPDGKIGYAPRANVAKLKGPDLYDRVADSIAPFDPVQALNIKKGVQEYKSGDYKLKAQAIERSVLDAGRLWGTDPQGALDAISNTHTLIPDGQQVKLAYDPKTGKVQSQFFTETPKGLIPQGKPQTVAFEDVMKQALAYASPENYWKNLEVSYNHTHQMAQELNQKAMLANEGARLELARSADKRAQDHQAVQDAYIKSRTEAIQNTVGNGWKVNTTKDADDKPIFTRVPVKGAPPGAKPQVLDNDWQGWVEPQYQGHKEDIMTAAQDKGLVARLGKDGKVYYINPKTNIMSTKIEEALSGKPAR